MKRMLLILALVIPAFCQSTVDWRASGTVSLNASASYSFTIQQNGQAVQILKTATISCGSNTFTVAQTQNGAAATATAITQTITGTLATSANGLVALAPAVLNTPLTLVPYSASNAGIGTAVSGPQPFSATAVIGLAGRVLGSYASGGAQVAPNYTLTVTNTGLGACTLLIEVLGSQQQ